MSKTQSQENTKFHFYKISKNKYYLVKVLLTRFHLNGDTIGFRSQIQKLKLTSFHKLTLGVKAFNTSVKREGEGKGFGRIGKVQTGGDHQVCRFLQEYLNVTWKLCLVISGDCISQFLGIKPSLKLPSLSFKLQRFSSTFPAV